MGIGMDYHCNVVINVVFGVPGTDKVDEDFPCFVNPILSYEIPW